MADYIALIRKDADSSYGVDFPDFPGCISGGETLDDALRGAGEALALHIEGMREDGDKIPAPSPLDDVLADEHNRGAIPFLVHAPSERAVRINISLDEGLLATVDRFVEATKFPGGRSGLLAEGAKAIVRDAKEETGGLRGQKPFSLSDHALPHRMR